jgi:hypothetical protein
MLGTSEALARIQLELFGPGNSTADPARRHGLRRAASAAGRLGLVRPGQLLLLLESRALLHNPLANPPPYLLY